MKPLDYAEEIAGSLFLTVKNFARLTNRSEQNVRFLITKGNRIRQLRIIRFAGKPMIYFSELTEFPFTVSGRGQEQIYHYDEHGQVRPEIVHGF